jgi:hypothetical protein
MPLIKNAKPGSKGFKKNIETEMHAHPDMNPKQAVAIAYSESGEHQRKHKERYHGKHGRG